MNRREHLKEYRNLLLVLQMGSSAAIPPLLFLLLALLLERYVHTPEWVTVALVLLGVFTGFWCTWKVILRLVNSATPSSTTKKDGKGEDVDEQSR